MKLKYGLNQNLNEAAFHFSNNPREIKRFMNVLRFQWFIMTSVAGPDTATYLTRLAGGNAKGRGAKAGVFQRTSDYML